MIGLRLVSVCFVALFSILLTGQDSIAQSDPCDPDPCATIPNAVADTCVPIGGSCSAASDFSCSCDPGYTWQGATNTCVALPPGPVAQIPAGSFWMGSPSGCPGPVGYPADCTSEPGRNADETLHYVTLTGSFELMTTEVTQLDFEREMGWNPSQESADCDDCPVENVSWFDAIAYANEMSNQATLTPCYTISGVTCETGGSPVEPTDYMACYDGTEATGGGIDNATVALNGASTPYDCEGYRLPTETEWEYAVRAGSYTAFYPSDGNDGSITPGTVDTCSTIDGNLDQIGWYCANDPDGTSPVGGKEENSWGLYDMSGNVSEWVWDWYSSSYPDGTIAAPTVDPTGPTSASFRVLRGGSWDSNAGHCRSAYRDYNSPGDRNSSGGFRLCRSNP